MNFADYLDLGYETVERKPKDDLQMSHWVPRLLKERRLERGVKDVHFWDDSLLWEN